jgi:ankyrin repeat protein
MRRRRAAILVLAAIALPASAGRRPIHDAALAGDLPRLKKALAARPGFLKKPDARGVLCMGAYSGNRAVVEFLLAKGAPLSDRDYDGATPLHRAASAGNIPIMALLIGKGVSVKETRADGWTPLHEAVASGDVRAVAFLLDRGADPNAAGGRRKETPLKLARAYRYRDVVALLEKRGAKE